MTMKNDIIRHESMRHYGFGNEVMMRIKVCGECGAVASADQIFCKECGARLPGLSLYEIYKERHTVCPYCDIILAENTLFCPQCGKSIQKTG